MTLPFNNKKIQEALRFILVGIIATGIQFAVYWICCSFCNHMLSLLISYVLSLCVNFLLSTYYTFRVQPNVRKGIGFLASHGVNFLLQLLFLNVFVLLGVAKEWALLPTLCICVPINFLLIRFAMQRL